MPAGPSDASFPFAEPFDPAAGVTVLTADATGPGNWVGCPSILWDPSRERFLLTYRRRRPRGGPPPDRGYECAIAESVDGVRFTDVWTVTKDAFESTSMERFNLQRDAHERYLLYVSYEHPDDGRWRIDVLEAEAPEAFDVERRRSVLTPAGAGTDAVKDPYVVPVGPAYYMYVSTFLTRQGPAPTYLATSRDGIRFDWSGEVLGVGSGWDRYQARLSGVVRSGGLFVGFYDGSASAEEDTEERLGLAVSPDLVSWTRISDEGPWLVSPHASGSLRYLDAIEHEGELWLYYEAARADGSHELRLNRVPVL